MTEASLIGRSINDRYRLLEVLGEGGMGRVFRAEQLGAGRPVALKLLHAEFSGVPEVVQRFEREAEVTTRLSHQNIVKLVDFGQWDGRFYLATEFLPGRSLAALLDATRDETRGGLTVERTAAIMRPVLDALEYAHRQGVVHRDLKPENIMVIPARGMFSGERVKLLDFGIAKLGDDDAQSHGPKLTQMGLLLGTPGYMSPEQAAGQQADERSDLYACGVIVYEMLAGRRPFEGDNLQVLAMHLNATPPSLRQAVHGTPIPPEVEAVVMRALRKEPPERFQSARELRLALESAAKARNVTAGVSGTDKTILATPAVRRPRAGWMRPAIIALALMLLIGQHLAPARSGNHREIASTVERRPQIPKAPSPSKRKDPGPKRARPAPKKHTARP
jgi:serine/threonine-protein kinase